MARTSEERPPESGRTPRVHLKRFLDLSEERLEQDEALERILGSLALKQSLGGTSRPS